MTISKLRLTGLTSVDLPVLSATPSDPYILKAADGLGPPEVDVSIMNGVYQRRVPQSREPVLRIGLNPNYAISQSVADLRQSMYGLLTPGSTDIVTLEIYDEFENIFALTRGYLKKFEIVPFNKDPEVQLTMACLLPYLEAPSQTVVIPEAKDSFTIENQGSAPTGLEMEFIFNADSPAGSSFTIWDSKGNKMQILHRFITGQRLLIDTNPGSKSVRLVNGSVTTTILASLSKDSEWFDLHGGSNGFSTSHQNFDWNHVRYTPKYWGV